MFKHFQRYFAKHYMANWTGQQWTGGADALMAGDVGMYMVGDWGSAYMKQRGFEPGVDYDFFSVPSMANITVIQPDGATLVANISPEDTVAGKNFLRSVASVEGQEAFSKYKGSMAANLRTPPDYLDYIGKRTYKDLTSAGQKTLPNLILLIPTADGFKQNFGSEIERFAANPTDEAMQAAMKSSEAQRQKLLAEKAYVNW